MNLYDWIKLVDEDNLDMILEELMPVFNTVDEYSDKSYKHQVDNPSIIDKALDMLQGCYGKIEIPLAIVNSELTTREARKYGEIKTQVINEKGKFTVQEDSGAKKEATESVAQLRRVDAILRNYLMTCSTGVSVLQSRLKVAIDPSKMSKDGH